MSVNEGRVLINLIDWITKYQSNNESSIKINFTIDKISFKLICKELEIEEEEDIFIEALKDKVENEDLLINSFTAIEDLWFYENENDRYKPDVVMHELNRKGEGSSVWLFEAKGSPNIRSGHYQAEKNMLFAEKSYLVIPKPHFSKLSNLDYKYGVMLYDLENNTIKIEKECGETSTSEIQKQYEDFIRKFHINYGRTLTSSSSKPYHQKKAHISGLIRLLFSTYYDIDHDESAYEDKIHDLVSIGVINKTPQGIKLSEEAIPILKLIDTIIDEKRQYSSRTKFNMIKDQLEDKLSRGTLLYDKENGSFGFYMSTLFYLILTRNIYVQQLLEFIRTAQMENDGLPPTLAHVVTVGMKTNVQLTSELFFIKSEKPPQFQWNSTRVKPNACAFCGYSKKSKNCFASDVKLPDYDNKKEVDESKQDFDKRYKEFFEIWSDRNHKEFFEKEKLRDKYISMYEYENGEEVEVFAPGLIKALFHTDVNKGMNLLRNARILDRGVRSGLMAESCPRFDICDTYDFKKELEEEQKGILYFA